MMREMICIVCPVGCHLNINTDTLEVTGNTCPKGEVYGREEITAPKRTITSTVKIKGGVHNRIPVKTNGSIPKDMNFDCMKELEKIELTSPVKVGDIVIKNLLNTGVDIVACRNM